MARQTPLCLWLSLLILAPGTATTAVAGERITAPRPSGHVPELRHYLDDLVVHQPLMHAGLAVFPLTLRRSEQLPGRWLTMDEAIRRKFLVVTERKGRATVPVIYAENRSPREHVFLMAGEVVSGGKQTRTIREDVVLAPAQKVDVGAFCVEAHRWSGTVQFGASRVMLPQSIQKEMRKGASQRRMWAEVSRSNRALKSQNATDSLELSLNASSVRTKLDPVRRAIVQEVPGASVGFIFVHRGRAVGGEFFGHSHMARALLPKLLDSYAVDLVLQQQERPTRAKPQAPIHIADAFLRRIRKAGSSRKSTPGSGGGIDTHAHGLVGAGVSLGRSLVHYGVQIEEKVIPLGPQLRSYRR